MNEAKKSFGQHFLRDRSVTRRIAAAAHVPGDVQIVEVGPGRGALTEEIVAAYPEHSLTLIEADRDLISNLKETFDAEVLQGDAAKFDFTSVTSGGPWIMLANLPYNAANAILMNALASDPPPLRMIVMVQKEVATRMMARPGEMSLLSLAVQIYAKPKRLFHVPPSAFKPKPKVDSTVMELVPHRDRDASFNEEILSLAKRGFASRRKQLHKNLAAANVASSTEVQQILGELNLPMTARAQELSVEAWKQLTAQLG